VKEFNYYYLDNQSDPDSVSIIVDYVKRDTTVNCDTYQNWVNCRSCIKLTAGGEVFTASSAPQQGVGGSMARFSIINNYMYGVSSYKLYAFNIANGADPQLANSKTIGGGIETIYPFQNKLFIGSTNGMFIYDITNPSDPVSQGMFSHVRSCDPVITDGQNAYVTLRSGNECNGFTNQMDVLNVSNLNSPSLVKTYQLTNPYGLSKDGNNLFVCDGKDGLKIYNASSPSNIQLIKTFANMETYDVITLNGVAIVVAKDGLYQYDYSNASDIRLLSKISISKQ
jgi:hypothetical protein